MKIGEKVKQRRKALGLSADDLAEVLGVSRSTVFRYENGMIEKLPSDMIEPLSKLLRTTPAYLMGWTDDPAGESSFENLYQIHLKKFPLLGEIACGEPCFVHDDEECFVESGSDLQADFCLRAKGDSMINARIYDGDIVFIHEQPMVENGEIAAVIIDNEATLKRVYYFPKDNKLLLNAENPNYAPLIYTGEELNRIRILGKAVAFQSKIL